MSAVIATDPADLTVDPQVQDEVRVVIVDDHAIVRRGLRQLLDSEPDCAVVAEGENMDSARRYVLGRRPRVLVIDLNMPGDSVLDALPQLRTDFPDTQIVVLTMQNEPAYARRALSAGALGYVLKEAADVELITAVQAAARGERFLNPRLGAKLAAEPDQRRPGGLSARELEVLSLLALGHANAQIGASLYLSVRTVETHRAHIQQKLGISDRPELVRFALRHGLISVDEDESR